MNFFRWVSNSEDSIQSKTLWFLFPTSCSATDTVLKVQRLHQQLKADVSIYKDIFLLFFIFQKSALSGLFLKVFYCVSKKRVFWFGTNLWSIIGLLWDAKWNMNIVFSGLHIYSPHSTICTMLQHLWVASHNKKNSTFIKSVKNGKANKFPLECSKLIAHLQNSWGKPQ